MPSANRVDRLTIDLVTGYPVRLGDYPLADQAYEHALVFFDDAGLNGSRTLERENSLSER
jgi:hypothetical protein